MKNKEEERIVISPRELEEIRNKLEVITERKKLNFIESFIYGTSIEFSLAVVIIISVFGLIFILKK